MDRFPTTIILRHRKENLKKCSLRGLEGRPDLTFLTYPWEQPQPDLSHTIVLTLDAPPLTIEDKGHPLFFIDGTWRYAEKMVASLNPPFLKRSLPTHIRTAYPRRQDDCADPARGLATVEALYAAYAILGRDTHGLLDHYHWAEEFLLLNEFSPCA